MKTNKNGKLIFDYEDYNKYFNYATSIREDSVYFAVNELSFKDLLRTAYYKPTKKLLKSWQRKLGTNGLRGRLRKIMKKFLYNGLPSFPDEIENKYIIL